MICQGCTDYIEYRVEKHHSCSLCDSGFILGLWFTACCYLTGDLNPKWVNRRSLEGHKEPVPLWMALLEVSCRICRPNTHHPLPQKTPVSTGQCPSVLKLLTNQVAQAVTGREAAGGSMCFWGHTWRSSPSLLRPAEGVGRDEVCGSHWDFTNTANLELNDEVNLVFLPTWPKSCCGFYPCLTSAVVLFVSRASFVKLDSCFCNESIQSLRHRLRECPKEHNTK